LSVVVLLLGIVVPYFLIEGTMWDKVGWGVKLNAEFHVSYLFFSWLPFFAHRLISRRGPYPANHARQVLMIFSWLVMILSVFGLVDFLNDALKSRDYVGMIFSLTHVALFLAAYLVRLKLQAMDTAPAS
jgi:hypothetical protein